jgi:hypothetical protein
MSNKSPLFYENQLGSFLTQTKNNLGYDSKKTTNTSTNLQDYDYQDIYNTLLTGDTSGSSGGGAAKTDISALLNAYDQQNQAANEAAKSNYEITKNSLLESLRRYQEQNATQQEQQKQQLVNSQSELADTGAQQARSERINAGTRGLSGSGIQQLNQLQKLTSQGSKVSDVASQNTEALTKLNEALTSKQDETQEALENALATYTNAVTNANTTYGDQAADIAMDAENTYANNLANSYSSSEDDSDYGLVTNDIYNILNGTTQQLQTNLNYISNLSNKQLKKYATANDISLDGVKRADYKTYIASQLRNDALDTINDLNETYPVSNSNYNAVTNNIYALLKNMK